MWNDLRYSIRQLRQRPGLTLAAILTLALGIGGNTVAYTWFQAVILNPLPGIADASRILALEWRSFDKQSRSLSWPDYRDIASQLTKSRLATFDMLPANLGEGGRPERIWTMLVSANYFDALGLKAQLGRTFVASEGAKPGEPAVIVLADHFWRDRFHSDPQVIGKTVRINNREFSVIGVAPPEFGGQIMGLTFDVFAPITMRAAFAPTQSVYWDGRGTQWMGSFVGLRPGANPDQAIAELNAVKAQVHRSIESNDRFDQATGTPVWRHGAGRIIGPFVLMLMAMMGMVLLIVCANVANLLLARALGRQHEIAVRFALGVSRSRLIRQMLTESLVLALAGGALGLLLTPWIIAAMNFTPPLDLPMGLNLTINWQAGIYTFAVSLIATLLCGLAPALRVSNPNLAIDLRSGTGQSANRGRALLQNSLVVAQVALSLFLLICSGLLLRSLYNASKADPGFDPRNALLASVELFPSGYDGARGRAFLERLMNDLRTQPGVASVTAMNNVPLGPDSNTSSVDVEGYTPARDESLSIFRYEVGPDFARTIGTRILAGRDVLDTDKETSPPVLLINQAFADRYLQGKDPIGHRVRYAGAWREIVGVLQTGKYVMLSESPRPAMFVPLQQVLQSKVHILVRSTGDPTSIAPVLRETIKRIDANLPIFNVRTFEAATSFGYLGQRMGGNTLAVIGAVALLLACLGLYGVVANSVVERTREMGIRLALGAERLSLLSLVMGHGLRLTIIGLAIGAVLAALSSRLLSSQLFGVSPYDPVVFVGVPVLLLSIAAAASYLPGRRATQIDPITAIRYE
jgi:predicted permease